MTGIADIEQLTQGDPPALPSSEPALPGQEGVLSTRAGVLDCCNDQSSCLQVVAPQMSLPWPIASNARNPRILGHQCLNPGMSLNGY